VFDRKEQLSCRRGKCQAWLTQFGVPGVRPDEMQCQLAVSPDPSDDVEPAAKEESTDVGKVDALMCLMA